MNTARVLVWLLVSGATASAAPQGAEFPASTPESQGLPPDALEDLDAAVTTFVERGWVVGAELLVIKNRRTVLHEAYGWRDREAERAMEKDTIFNLRSMAKPLVQTTTQLAVAQGELRLEDPVARHLPSFDHDGAATITVEHLLTHRSGLPDRNPPGPREQYQDLRSVADSWGQHGPSESPPGTAFLYSDPGYDVLGAVLAAAGDGPLEALVTERLLRPLGMDSSFAMTTAEDPRRDRIASAYLMQALKWRRYWQPGDAPLVPFVRGSGSTWYGSPRDYARFLTLWLDHGDLDGEPFLAEAAIERSLRPVSVFDQPTRIPGVEVHYGAGWVVYVRPEDDGAGAVVGFGHSGSDGTYAWAFPQQDLMVLYFTQSRGQRTRLSLEAKFGALLKAPRLPNAGGEPGPAALD